MELLKAITSCINYFRSSLDEVSTNVRASKHEVIKKCSLAFATILLSSGLAVFIAARQSSSASRANSGEETYRAQMMADRVVQNVHFMHSRHSRVPLGVASASKRHPRVASELHAAAADFQTANLAELPLPQVPLESSSVTSSETPRVPVQATPITPCKLAEVSQIPRSPSFSDWL